MNKWQAINDFWNRFNIPAYDENSIPDDIDLPYISYSVQVGSLGDTLLMTASIYDRSTSWKFVSDKADAIADYVGRFVVLPLDNGYLWLTPGVPFAQRMSDDVYNDTIKRMYIVLNGEFLTNH